MRKKRLVPVVLLRNGVVVQSKGFKRWQALGNPATIVARLSNWASDELIYLDITREGAYDLRRDDTNFANRGGLLEILDDVSRKCFMPLTFGGGIRTAEDVAVRLARGADKVAINTQALAEPAFITRCAHTHGAQCIVVSMDVRARTDGQPGWEVFADSGRQATARDAVEWAREAADRGAGELLLNSIDRDGAGQGYDLPLIEAVSSAVRIPVIALGGVGAWEHLGAGLDAGAAAVAAGNIFHYTENSVFNAARWLHERGYPVRRPALAALATEGDL